MSLLSEIKSAISSVFEKVESHVHNAVTFTSDEIKKAELAFVAAASDPTVLTLSAAFEAGVAFATQTAKEAVSAVTAATTASDTTGVPSAAAPENNEPAQAAADPEPAPQTDPVTSGTPDADPVPAQPAE